MRADGKDLTADEWVLLWDMLMSLMDRFGGGPAAVTDVVLDGLKATLKDEMKQQGLLRGSGEGAHCWGCGAEGDTVELRKCARCKNARYCSKECQSRHWEAGHKQSCVRLVSAQQTLAEKEAQLLQTAVLKPEQVIERNAPLPPMPMSPPPVLRAMPADHATIFVYNRRPGSNLRFCPTARHTTGCWSPAPMTSAAVSRRSAASAATPAGRRSTPPAPSTPRLSGTARRHQTPASTV